jgi:hypothetical protein
MIPVEALLAPGTEAKPTVLPGPKALPTILVTTTVPVKALLTPALVSPPLVPPVAMPVIVPRPAPLLKTPAEIETDPPVAFPVRFNVPVKSIPIDALAPLPPLAFPVTFIVFAPEELIPYATAPALAAQFPVTFKTPVED